MFGLGKRKGQYAERYNKIGAGQRVCNDPESADDDLAELPAEELAPADEPAFAEAAPVMPPVVLPSTIDGQSEPAPATNSVPDPAAAGLAWGHDHPDARAEENVPAWLDLAAPCAAEDQVAPFVEPIPQDGPALFGDDHGEPAEDEAPEPEPAAIPDESPEPAVAEVPPHVSAVAAPPEPAAPEITDDPADPTGASPVADDGAVAEQPAALPADAAEEPAATICDDTAVAEQRAPANPADPAPVATKPQPEGQNEQIPAKPEPAAKPAGLAEPVQAVVPAAQQKKVSPAPVSDNSRATARRPAPAADQVPAVGANVPRQPRPEPRPEPGPKPEPEPRAKPAAARSPVPELSDDEVLEIGTVARSAAKPVTRPASATPAQAPARRQQAPAPTQARQPGGQSAAAQPAAKPVADLSDDELLEIGRLAPKQVAPARQPAAGKPDKPD